MKLYNIISNKSNSMLLKLHAVAEIDYPLYLSAPPFPATSNAFAQSAFVHFSPLHHSSALHIPCNWCGARGEETDTLDGKLYLEFQAIISMINWN